MNIMYFIELYIFSNINFKNCFFLKKKLSFNNFIKKLISNKILTHKKI